MSFLAHKNIYKLSTSHNKAITYIMPECLNVEALKPSLFSCLIVTLCCVIELNKHCNIDFVVFLLLFCCFFISAFLCSFRIQKILFDSRFDNDNIDVVAIFFLILEGCSSMQWQTILYSKLCDKKLAHLVPSRKWALLCDITIVLKVSPSFSRPLYREREGDLNERKGQTFRIWHFETNWLIYNHVFHFKIYFQW